MGFNHNYLEFKILKLDKLIKLQKKYSQKKKRIVEFDYLIMAAGTRTFFPPSIMVLIMLMILKNFTEQLLLNKVLNNNYLKNKR